MKHLLISIAFLLTVSASVFGQTFTVKELISLYQKDYDNFETKVTSKGYSFDELEKGEFFDQYSFSFKRNQSNSNASKFITYSDYVESDRVFVSYQTLVLTEYTKLKAECKALGFNFYEKEEFNGGVFLKYKKGKIEVAFYSAKDSNNQTVYEISINQL